MKIIISGAGKVGRSIARDLVDRKHSVCLVDKVNIELRKQQSDNFEFHVGDICEIAFLEKIDFGQYDIYIAASGDDKVNLVSSFLAKIEFGVPRVIARINHPKNEWMFNERWGVDTAVSTPRLVTALVEEAVSVGDLIRLLTFQKGKVNLLEITLPETSDHIGKALGSIPWPQETAVVAVIRDETVLLPDNDLSLEQGDELLFITSRKQEDALAGILGGGAPKPLEDELSDEL